jgi:hypothetical protein
LLAALVPLSVGTRITVREAISTYGLTGAVGMVDRMVAKARNVPYSLLLTVGNTFRNQRRVVVVEVALVVAGTIFMPNTPLARSWPTFTTTRLHWPWRNRPGHGNWRTRPVDCQVSRQSSRGWCSQAAPARFRSQTRR